MTTRTIVTSHPDVACDVCGRRLLRGEQPDIFVGAGQRRLVCELCTSRATQVGWRRETAEHTMRPRAERPQRGRSLLARLRQSRQAGALPDQVLPAQAVPDQALAAQAVPARAFPAQAVGAAVGIDAEWTSVDEEWAGAEWRRGGGGASPDADADADADVRRALEVFNAGRYPRRLAGVMRALGEPTVRAAPPAGATVAIVVAWELCWYRYEIDLGDEARGALLTAEGTELGELAAEELRANAAADERGELSLLG